MSMSQLLEQTVPLPLPGLYHDVTPSPAFSGEVIHFIEEYDLA